MAPSHLERRPQLRLAEGGKRRAGPALAAPGVVERGEGVGRDRALERLFILRELDVGAQFVRGEGRERDARLEGAAIEVRVFGDARERKRDPAEIGGVGRGPLAE